jgi:hypothetical protein
LNDLCSLSIGHAPWLPAILPIALSACDPGRVPRCDGNVLVRDPTEREAVEGGYTGGDGYVHQDCLTDRCVEAEGAAECVEAPLEPCTDGTACVTGDGWAACAVAEVPCETAVCASGTAHVLELLTCEAGSSCVDFEYQGQPTAECR